MPMNATSMYLYSTFKFVKDATHRHGCHASEVYVPNIRTIPLQKTRFIFKEQLHGTQSLQVYRTVQLYTFKTNYKLTPIMHS